MRPQGKEHWETVRTWEAKTGKHFEDIVAELRSNQPPDEVIRILGVSRGFLYYHFGHAMDRIRCIEKKYGKSLGEVVLNLRDRGFAMTEIATNLGLAVTTLYNHLNKTRQSKKTG